MKTQEYLDKIKSRLSINSDYALSKALGVSRQAVSRYQKGHGQFDDEIAIRAAEILEINPGIVILDMHRERAQTDKQKNAWRLIAEGFRTLLPHAKLLGLSPTW